MPAYNSVTYRKSGELLLKRTWMLEYLCRFCGPVIVIDRSGEFREPKFCPFCGAEAHGFSPFGGGSSDEQG